MESTIGGMLAGTSGFKIDKVTAENYIPCDEDIFLESGSSKQRLIFGPPLMFSDEEMDKIEEFNEFLDNNDLQIPKQYDFREKYRYLQGCGFDHQKTYDSIMSHKNFMIENLPVDMSGGIEDLLNTGVFYFYKRDKGFRPI